MNKNRLAREQQNIKENELEQAMDRNLDINEEVKLRIEQQYKDNIFDLKTLGLS